MITLCAEEFLFQTAQEVPSIALGERPRSRIGFSRLRFVPGPQTHELLRRGGRADRGAPGTLGPSSAPARGTAAWRGLSRTRALAGVCWGSRAPSHCLFLSLPARRLLPSWRSCTTGSASAAPSTAPPTPASRPSTPTKYWPRAFCPLPPPRGISPGAHVCAAVKPGASWGDAQAPSKQSQALLLGFGVQPGGRE